MTASHPLFQDALEIANGAARRKLKLERNKLDLQAKLQDVEAQLEAADIASNRATSFQVHRDGREQCPRCWIEHEMAVDLTPLRSDDRDDEFRCRSCGYEVTISHS